MIKRTAILLLLLVLAFSSFAQPNCEAYKYLGDTLKYQACKKAEEIEQHYQFSKEFQEILDEAIAIDPTFAYAYREKSVAYLKSGDFISWKNLIDKAVALNPEEHLGARGWCRYQFFRDYKGAIADIEKLDSLISYDIGYSVNGDYHLNVAKALCYRALGQHDKALAILEKQLADTETFAGIYANLHAGVMYLQAGRIPEAIEAFQEQSRQNEMADNQYYLALAYKALGENEACRSSLQRAKELYLMGLKMLDPYAHPYDKVYLAQIEQELLHAQNNK